MLQIEKAEREGGVGEKLAGCVVTAAVIIVTGIVTRGCHVFKFRRAVEKALVQGGGFVKGETNPTVVVDNQSASDGQIDQIDQT